MSFVPDWLNEQWRPLPCFVGTSFEGYYEVSDMGRVRSLDRTVTFTHGRYGTLTRFCPGRMLKIQERKIKTHYGYLLQRIALLSCGSGGAEFKRICVARAVWQAFVGVIPVGHEVSHKAGLRGDDRLTSLVLLTKSEQLKAPNRRYNYAALAGQKRDARGARWSK